jgi:hypothetical protein
MYLSKEEEDNLALIQLEVRLAFSTQIQPQKLETLRLTTYVVSRLAFEQILSSHVSGHGLSKKMGHHGRKRFSSSYELRKGTKKCSGNARTAKSGAFLHYHKPIVVL